MIFDLETTGLEPMTDRITCISYYSDGETKTIMGEDEKEIITKFFNNIEEYLIGFNIEGFDIPFLIKRALINKIKIPNFKQHKIIDLRKVVNAFFYSYNKYEKGSLDDWSSVLNGGIKKETSGLECVEAFKIRDWETIKKHCEYDVYITKLLYERCKECGLL